MSGEMMFAAITIATMVYSVWIIAGQRKMIEKLNDRLMARSYGEYKSIGVKEEDASPKEDEPKGWYDH